MPRSRNPIQTAQTMTPDSLPKGARVEEFLGDADLVAYRDRELAALEPDDPARGAAVKAARQARLAAALTAAAQPYEGD